MVLTLGNVDDVAFFYRKLIVVQFDDTIPFEDNDNILGVFMNVLCKRLVGFKSWTSGLIRRLWIAECLLYKI